MTGFECLAAFVIRRAKHTPKGAARHWQQKLCLGIRENLMSFPIEQVRLNSLSSRFNYVMQIYYLFLDVQSFC